MQPVKGCYTENERAKIKKWCKLARDVKANRHKTRAGCVEACVSDLSLFIIYFNV
jgi:hypothetical protein